MNSYSPAEGYRAHDALRLGKPFTSEDGIVISYIGDVSNPASQKICTSKGDEQTTIKLLWGSEGCFIALKNHRHDYP